jgi:ATP-dependent RNA helicase DHX37/DHR1
MSGTFGNRAWPITPVELEYPRGIEKMKWFARFLLEGEVIAELKKFTPDLLSPPATMIKTWAKYEFITSYHHLCAITDQLLLNLERLIPLLH